MPFAGPAWWAAALLLAGALLLQIEIMHYVTFRNAEPSLVLVLVVWYALHADWRRAAMFGIAAGACEDAFDITGGAWTISTALTALWASVLSRWFFSDSIPVAAAVAFLCTLLRALIFWSAMSLTAGYPAGYARVHFHQALWMSVMNAALMAIALALVRRREERALA
ncbi:MAG: rod shape-determining protein MreD [Candidatus Baltobacteraceae bacterium]